MMGSIYATADFYVTSRYSASKSTIIISDAGTTFERTFATLAKSMNYTGPIYLKQVSLLAVSSASLAPSPAPSNLPTAEPTHIPTKTPTFTPSQKPTFAPTPLPSSKALVTSTVSVTFANPACGGSEQLERLAGGVVRSSRESAGRGVGRRREVLACAVYADDGVCRQHGGA